jgi:predicted RNA-binding protein Jag
MLATKHSVKSNSGQGVDLKRSFRGVRGDSVFRRSNGSHSSKSFDGIRVLSRAEIKENWLAKMSQKEMGDIPDSQTVSQGSEMTEAENKKRMFLKMAGVVGLGTAATLLFPKKAEAIVFGSTPASNVVGVKDAGNTRINPAKEDGNLATIKTNTDGLVASGAGGYIRQDSTATIAKETGGNLASIKTSADTLTTAGGGGYVRQDSTATIAKETGGNLSTLATNIPAKGQALMAASMPVVIASDQTAIPVSGSFSVEAVGLKDTKNTAINPATEDAITYLRRMVKLMESQATVDAGNRQRITIDSLGTGTAVTTTIPVSGTVTATVSSAAISTMAGQNQQMFQDVARNTYANGIRQNLVFS